MDVVDVLLLAAVALGFSAGVVATTRLLRWFGEPARGRVPTLIEPS